MVVLKMVAWLDRPEERQRDLGDLAQLLEHALSDDDPRRWDENEPLATAGVPFDLQSAFHVGGRVAAIVDERHLAHVRTFLDRLLREDGRWSAVMAREAQHLPSDGDDRVRAMLEAFRSGISAVQSDRS